MRTWSRGLRDTTLHVLAGLGLMLALTVMGFVLAVSAAQGDSGEEYALSATTPDAPSVASETKRTDVEGSSDSPSGIGIMLGVLVLGAGVTVLALGARRTVPDSSMLGIIAVD